MIIFVILVCILADTNRAGDSAAQAANNENDSNVNDTSEHPENACEKSPAGVADEEPPKDISESKNCDGDNEPDSENRQEEEPAIQESSTEIVNNENEVEKETNEVDVTLEGSDEEEAAVNVIVKDRPLTVESTR